MSRRDFGTIDGRALPLKREGIAGDQGAFAHQHWGIESAKLGERAEIGSIALRINRMYRVTLWGGGH